MQRLVITPLAQRLQRNPEAVLRPCPVERHTLAGAFQQCRLVALDGPAQRLVITPLAKHAERVAKVDLGRCPVQRRAFASALQQRSLAALYRAVQGIILAAPAIDDPVWRLLSGGSFGFNGQ